MSSTTLQFKFRVGGALTAATSVVLSDATGTYGVRRTDTAATVVADGTAMTAASTGVYEYTFTDPAAGLTYQWVAEVVYAGSTLRFQFTSDGGAGDVPEGRYTSYTLLKQRFGTTNVIIYSNTEGGETLDTASIEAAITDAEDFIDGYFSGSAYAVPFTATGADLPHQLQDWATVLAGYWLYTKRGLHDDDAKMGGKFQKLRDGVLADMAKVKAGFRTLLGVTASGNLTAPTSIAPEYDRYGLPNNTTTNPYRYGRPYGYGWW